jgi:hypothetical protein
MTLDGKDLQPNKSAAGRGDEDEKKMDDEEIARALSEVTSPASAEKSNGNDSSYNTYLFSDDSPSSTMPDAAEISMDTFVSPSSLVSRILREDSSKEEASPPASDDDDDAAPAPAPAGGGAAEDHALRLASGTLTPVRHIRMVQFAVDSPTASTSSFNEGASEEHLLDRLTKVQERLTQTQIDLSGEKAISKRKEKNLVKLAKELQKRSAVLDTKDKQIVKVRHCCQSIEYVLRVFVLCHRYCRT